MSLSFRRALLYNDNDDEQEVQCDTPKYMEPPPRVVLPLQDAKDLCSEAIMLHFGADQQLIDPTSGELECTKLAYTKGHAAGYESGRVDGYQHGAQSYGELKDKFEKLHKLYEQLVQTSANLKMGNYHATKGSERAHGWLAECKAELAEKTAWSETLAQENADLENAKAELENQLDMQKTGFETLRREYETEKDGLTDEVINLQEELADVKMELKTRKRAHLADEVGIYCRTRARMA